MSAYWAADKRLHVRHAHAAGLSFLHEPSGKSYPARTVDVSAGGLLMQVPPAAPIQAGHRVQITLKDDPSSPQPLPATTYATVVRVERHKLLATAALSVAVQFDPA